MEKILEVCCGTYADALEAYKGGAKRVELNSALFLGGLTPSIGSLLLTKKNTNLKVIAMIRPRAAGFCYEETDYITMKIDAENMMKHGADGIAFGCLAVDGSIHESRTKELSEIAKIYGGEAVFHRAFDCVENPYESMESLIALGIDRVLTSGLKDRAEDGILLMRELQSKYGNKVELLAGSGINSSNAVRIMKETGIYQIHSSCKGWEKDLTTEKGEVSYSYGGYKHEMDYEVVDKNLVCKLIESINE